VEYDESYDDLGNLGNGNGGNSKPTNSQHLHWQEHGSDRLTGTMTTQTEAPASSSAKIVSNNDNYDDPDCNCSTSVNICNWREQW
jgi:hypothetical protein